MSKVIRTERGWIGHYICADRCLFRRNTLLEYGDFAIIISTIGLMKTIDKKSYEEVGAGRYFETMVFHAKKNDRWKDANISKQIYPDTNCYISELDADDKANDMHEAIIKEFIEKLINNKIKESR